MNRLRDVRRRLVMVTLIALGGGLMTIGLDTPATLAAPSAGAIARATEIEGRLDLPAPASRRVARVADSDSGLIIDEVIDLDRTGSPTAISRFNPGGQLISLVRLGYTAQTNPTIPSARAGERASSVVASLDLPVTGLPDVTPRATGGWLVRWVRLAGAVPVPGDGVSVQLGADGSVHAIVRTEHRLGPPPAVPLEAAYVRLLAEARLDRWFAANLRGDASVGPPKLAWVAPNNTFGDAVPTAGPGELRLAWVVRVNTSGALAEQVAGLELAFDAGDGIALGGDLLE